jgi:predicted NUDIX family NTP pyrophosphohydrolase
MITSAGILPYTLKHNEIYVYLAKTGGPYFSNIVRNWSIVKGRIEKTDNDLLETAIREFYEETNYKFSYNEKFSNYHTYKTKDKQVYVFFIEKDIQNLFTFKSNLFEIEWPPNSGTLRKFPEMDEGKYFSIKDAKQVMFKSQLPILSILESKIIRS